MRHAGRARLRRFAPAFAPVLLVAAALPLMAPTCQPTTPGVKTFSKGSIIIPMDRCYQGDAGTPTGCASGDAGNVLQAYGVVYQLIKNNIPVYWVIKQSKASLTDVDVTVQLDGGAPVGVYNWTPPGAVGAMPPNNTTFVIDYRGGPFVVDGSDQAAVFNLFQNGNAATNTPALRTLYSAVKVHVSKVAFQGYAAKTFAGGWNAGGTVAPPIALLDICGGDGIYAEAVIQGYLTNAGLDFAGAGGNATDTGHGQIYDRLFASDFIPSTPGNWTTSNLGKYVFNSTTGAGYRILWAPHWEGLNSYASSAGCSGSRLPNQSDIDPIVKTIGGFVSAGHDLMSECASIGTLEGVYQTGTSTPVTAPGGTCSGSTNCFGIGTAETRFQTTGTGAFPGGGGVYINEAASGGSTVGTFNSAFYPSPFLQIGDFPFTPTTGAIDSYRPASANGSVTYRTGVSSLINNGAGVDYFTLLPSPPSAGVVVYLSGHTYIGQIAGTRLVLNTLFNLGAGCVETLAPCNTGKLGVCAEGEMRCVSNVPTCVQKTQSSAEICDGKDNDCNGAVDDGLTQACYDGPNGTQGVGICHGGTKSCVETSPGGFGMSACLGQVLPAAEDCNGLDDDCNGTIDDLAPRACYDGPAGTQNVGTCRGGMQSCSGGSWGVCDGEVLPLGYDVCEPVSDTNCNGAVGDGCSCYPVGSTRICYGGPAGTENVGACRAGTQTCNADGTLGACTGVVLPAARACNGLDNDCDGVVDTEQMCCDGGAPATSRTCYGGPAGTLGVGVCRGGTQTCAGAVWSPTCSGEILPGPELCNGKDDDCDGVSDNGTPACAAGSSCQNGVCVPTVCGSEGPFCPGGYTCSGIPGTCVLGNCGTTGSPCPTGRVCQGSACVDPCQGVTCGQGAYCSGGQCVGGGCYATGCPTGQLCLGGTCQADPCDGVSCPSGTFCREGYCVQSCVFVACTGNQRCGADGFCVTDPCAGRTCGAGQVCQGGGCVANPCAAVTCGSGQVCDTASGDCVSDPCNGVSCPVGQCLAGQCYSSNPGGGPPTPVSTEPAKSGCGCGAAGGGELGLLLLGLLLPWRRRRTPRAAQPRRALRPSGAALALLLALTAGAAGCSKSEEPTPAPCTSPNCNGACVDFAVDTANCGSCGHACAAGQICVDGGCGPSSAVAPYVTAVNPTSAQNGASRTVSLTGQRFQTGAQVALLGAGAQSVAATVTDAGHLTATFDLTAASPGAAEIRVVNPDNVISNGADFDVTLAAPVLTGLACQGSSCVTAGGTEATTGVGSGTAVDVTLLLSGTGLVAGSQCRIASASFAEIGLPSTLSGGQVQCTLDLRLTDPGDYQVTVVNGGVARSNALTFTVRSRTPTLTAISPTAAQAGQVIALTVDGSGFDGSSEVLVDGQATFNGSAIVTTFVSGGRLNAQPVNLVGVATGTHQVSVRNGAVQTSTLPFQVTQAAPSLATVSPTSARQGAAVNLAVTGANFDASTRIELQAPGAGTFTPIAATVVDSATQAHAPYTFGQAGSWLVRVSNGAGASGPLSVRVLSNVAVLSDVSPPSAQQGQTVNLVLTATNLDPGGAPVVHLASASLGCPSAPCSLDRTPTVSGSTLTVSGLSLSGWDAGTFSVAVVNAGAQPSNSLGFTATPGTPTLASVSPSACVMQSATPVALTLTGTNFAKPDASGNGGSTVHASSAAVADYTVPGVTVVNPTKITVDFDSSAAIPDTYALQIWNPGPTILKSGTIAFKVAASYATPPLNTCP
jgi:hypothetical protein